MGTYQFYRHVAVREVRAATILDHQDECLAQKGVLFVVHRELSTSLLTGLHTWLTAQVGELAHSHDLTKAAS